MISTFARKVEKMGFDIVLGETVTYMTDSDHTAGTPETRAHDFNRMINDPNIKAIWAGAGGFGAQSIVEHIDFEALKRNPKIIIGFSDTTFLLNTINKKTGLVTFLGPTAEMGSEKDLQSLDRCLRMLMGINEYPHMIENIDGSFIRSISYIDKQVVGKIVGGNLTMIQTSIGTDWEVETDGKILLLEEVGESSYSIERTLQHMKSAGKFDRPAAVVFGEFTSISKEPLRSAQDSNPSINEILIKVFKKADYPVLGGYNFSHGDYNLTFPVGGIGKVDGNTNTLEVLEQPVK